jgi:UDP-N-acetylmuramoyl-tripeptide--D-alanyl-D-alanine ligase
MMNSQSVKPQWTIEQIARWSHGKILSTHQTTFHEVGTDTRKDLTGQVFIALKGDNYDAHDYLDKAVEKGAGLLFVQRLDEKFADLKNKVSIIEMPDTLKGLQEFANGYRKTLSAKIIGITGSNGKTTTKEFTAAILNQFKKTHFNQGSFNNHWGVPLTLLQIPQNADIAVVEMGMNHAGEITELVKIADPDIVVCTMVGRAHIEYFGTQKKIAEAKAEIYMESREDTIRVFNQDQDLTYDMMYPIAKKYPASRMLSFSERNKDADVFFKIDELSAEGLKISGNIASRWGAATVPVFGKHNLTNIMAAANLAYAAGMSPEQIWQALPACKSTWGRNQFVETMIGVHILFDGYNANPDSMKALLENIPLLATRGKKIGVFGQMKELGTQAPEMHRELAIAASMSGYDFIYFVGENYQDFEGGLKHTDYAHYKVESDLTESMGQHFVTHIASGDLITIKGSRGAKTERFVELCEPVNWEKK